MPYYVLLFLGGFLGLILQSTFFAQLTIAGVKPDLLLLLVIFNSFFAKPQQSFIFGFFLGLLEDLYLGSYIGMNAIAKSITAFVGSRFLKGTFRENLLVPVLALFLASLFNGLLLILLGKTLGLQWDWALFYWKVIPLAIYNTCLVPFLYSGFFHWVKRDLEQSSL